VVIQRQSAFNCPVKLAQPALAVTVLYTAVRPTLGALRRAASLARDLGEAPRHRDYLDSCRRALQFLDSLIIQPRDATVLPNPALALGGLRRSSRRSEIYVDFVQHYLAAVLETDQASLTG